MAAFALRRVLPASAAMADRIASMDRKFTSGKSGCSRHAQSKRQNQNGFPHSLLLLKFDLPPRRPSNEFGPIEGWIKARIFN